MMALVIQALVGSAAAQCNQWQPVSSPWDYVYAITSFHDQLFASGDLYDSPGAVPHTARWDGTAWQPIDAGLYGGVSSFVIFNDQLHAAATLLIDGKMFPAVVRWDGNQWQPLGVWPGPSIAQLTIFDGSLVASGSNVWRWDGTSWIQFGGNLSFAGAMTVFDGQLVVAASGGPNTPCVWRCDGAAWEPLGCFAAAVENPPEIDVLAVYGNELIVGGFFSSVDGQSANCIARWDGSMWRNLGYGVDNLVFALMTYHDDLLVGGAFAFAGGQSSDAIARWDGAAWLPIGDCNGGIVFDLTLHNHDAYSGGLLYSSRTPSSMHGIDRWSDCCVTDANVDGVINVDDLLSVINHWGRCPPIPQQCPDAITADGQVNIDDLLAVIGAWGPCTYTPK
jgi:hypothetical protein